MTLFRELAGGLGLFLYGLTLLSRGLTAAAGARLLPGRAGGAGPAPGFGALCRWAALGAGVTAVLQSSGAVTVFAVGAADAGLLPVPLAVALCWGANLGTTATGQLLRLTQAGLCGPALRALCCLAGALLALPRRTRAGGEALLGLGLTFTGLAAVQAALAPLAQGPVFRAWLGQMQHPLAAFCFGALLSAALQSSSGAVGLVQAAAAGGTLCWRAAVPLVLGINVGTCTTALAAALAARGRRSAARQVAAGHLCFNLAGSLVFGASALLLARAAFWAQPADFAAVADFHTAFNGATLALLLPLAGLRQRRAAAACASPAE